MINEVHKKIDDFINVALGVKTKQDVAQANHYYNELPPSEPCPCGHYEIALLEYPNGKVLYACSRLLDLIDLYPAEKIDSIDMRELKR